MFGPIQTSFWMPMGGKNCADGTVYQDIEWLSYSQNPTNLEVGVSRKSIGVSNDGTYFAIGYRIYKLVSNVYTIVSYNLSGSFTSAASFLDTDQHFGLNGQTVYMHNSMTTRIGDNLHFAVGEDANTGSVTSPSFVNRNFNIMEYLGNDLWFASNMAVGDSTAYITGLTMDKAGTRLAIVYFQKSNSSRYLNIYDWNGSSWNLSFNILVATYVQYNPYIPDVAISGDGNTIAVDTMNPKIYRYSGGSWNVYSVGGDSFNKYGCDLRNQIKLSKDGTMYVISYTGVFSTTIEAHKDNGSGSFTKVNTISIPKPFFLPYPSNTNDFFVSLVNSSNSANGGVDLYSISGSTFDGNPPALSETVPGLALGMSDDGNCLTVGSPSMCSSTVAMVPVLSTSNSHPNFSDNICTIVLQSPSPVPLIAGQYIWIFDAASSFNGALISTTFNIRVKILSVSNTNPTTTFTTKSQLVLNVNYFYYCMLGSGMETGNVHSVEDPSKASYTVSQFANPQSDRPFFQYGTAVTMSGDGSTVVTLAHPIPLFNSFFDPNITDYLYDPLPQPLIRVFKKGATEIIIDNNPYPQLSLLDNFIDTVGTSATLHTSDSGQTWYPDPAQGTGDSSPNVHIIDPSGCLSNNPSLGTFQYLQSSFIPSQADYAITATLTTPSSGGFFSFDLYGRMIPDPSNTSFPGGYALELGYSGSWNLSIFDLSQGIRVNVSTALTGIGFSKQYTLIFYLKGSTLLGYINGVLKVSATDSFFTQPGQIGLTVWPNMNIGAGFNNISVYYI